MLNKKFLLSFLSLATITQLIASDADTALCGSNIFTVGSNGSLHCRFSGEHTS